MRLSSGKAIDVALDHDPSVRAGGRIVVVRGLPAANDIRLRRTLIARGQRGDDEQAETEGETAAEGGGN